MDNPKMRLNNISVGYTSRRKKQTAVLEHLNATLKSGELTCLIGQNGAGKSTLLRTMSGFLSPLEGRIDLLLSGKGQQGDTTYRSLYGISHTERARQISIVLTEKPPTDGLTVAEVVEMGRSPYTNFWGMSSPEDKQIVKEALHAVGIQALAARKLHTLSDGERQKTMIAKALAQQSPIVLLDEPTAFLDFPSKVETMQLLQNLAHSYRKAILVSTHDLELAVCLADTIWLIDNDRQLHIGSPRQLADEGILSRFVDKKGIKFDRDTLAIKIKS